MKPDVILDRVKQIEKDKWYVVSLHKISRLGKFIQRENKGNHWHQREVGNEESLNKRITTICLG